MNQEWKSVAGLFQLSTTNIEADQVCEDMIEFDVQLSFWHILFYKQQLFASYKFPSLVREILMPPESFYSTRS